MGETYNRSDTARDFVEEYSEKGFVGPFAAISPTRMETLREQVVRDVIGLGAHQLSADSLQCRHLDDPVVYGLCTLPEILDRVSALYGPDILLWRSHFWCKQPGDGAVAWHQDLTHWPLDPVINVTAWLAIDPATRENACLRVIPGSNARVYPTEPQTGDPLTDSVRADCIEQNRIVHMELRPGEFFLFDEKLVHGSAANYSSFRRLGLAIRMTVPTVRVDHSRLLGGRHRNIVVRGRDEIGLNLNQEPPAPAMGLD